EARWRTVARHSGCAADAGGDHAGEFWAAGWDGLQCAGQGGIGVAGCASAHLDTANSAAHIEPRLFQTVRELAAQSHWRVHADEHTEDELSEFGTAGGPGERRQDLSKPFRCAGIGD